MEIRLVPYLLLVGCGTLACLSGFYLSDRKADSSGSSLSLTLWIFLLGGLLGLGCARLVWVLFCFYMHPPLFVLSANELSYYGGMAGVLLGVFLAAKLAGRQPGAVLNAFAPAGAFLAAVFRFGEGFLGMLGFGTYLEEGVFFPVTVEIAYDEYFSEFYLAVFMAEGIFCLLAAVFSLLRRADRYRCLRTLFCLCLPQILCESLRLQSIRWLFVRAEQLVCFLLCESVLVFYALRSGPRHIRSWVPALAGLGVCGVVVAVEFALEGKITFGGQALSHPVLYAVMAFFLLLLAVAEHLARRRLET